MKIKKITRKNLPELIKPTGKQFYIIEEGSLGFGVRVSRIGHAVYVLRTKHSGQTKDLTIAKVHELTPRGARQKANLLLLSLSSNRIDQKLPQPSQYNGVTLGEAMLSQEEYELATYRMSDSYDFRFPRYSNTSLQVCEKGTTLYTDRHGNLHIRTSQGVVWDNDIVGEQVKNTGNIFEVTVTIRGLDDDFLYLDLLCDRVSEL